MNSVRSRKEIALPVTRTLNLRTLSSQRWKESINHEVSSLAKASHPNIRNIVAIKGSDLLCLSLEPILGMSLRDILRKSALTNNHVSGLCSKVGRFVQVYHESVSLFDVDCPWLATSAPIGHHTRQFEFWQYFIGYRRLCQAWCVPPNLPVHIEQVLMLTRF